MDGPFGQSGYREAEVTCVPQRKLYSCRTPRKGISSSVLHDRKGDGLTLEKVSFDPTRRKPF